MLDPAAEVVPTKAPDEINRLKLNENDCETSLLITLPTKNHFPQQVKKVLATSLILFDVHCANISKYFQEFPN